MKKISRRQWICFSIWAVLYLLFCIWMVNPWLLLGEFVIMDIFLTKRIPWGAWKQSKNKHVREALEWVDDILFALIAVYFINVFVFQNYQIPTASLEKTLLVGDYLFVSKLSYGPRVPNTPLSFPLVQNTLPFFNCKSYLDWPRWGYKRVKGFGRVQQDPAQPAGATVPRRAVSALATPSWRLSGSRGRGTTTSALAQAASQSSWGRAVSRTTGGRASSSM